MLTQLEIAAIGLINEVESNIRLGVPLTSALVNAADNFRKVQARSALLLGADLDDMYKRVKQVEDLRAKQLEDREKVLSYNSFGLIDGVKNKENVVKFNRQSKLKLVKSDEGENK